MDFKIELWLRGYVFCCEVIEVPERDDRMTFEQHVEYRESLFRTEDLKIRSNHWRQIDKCSGICQVYIIAPSKIEYQPFDNETDNGEDERQNENSAYADDRDS